MKEYLTGIMKDLEEMTYFQKDSHIVCHYTSVNTLCEITRCFQDSNDKCNISFRASNIFYTNDKLEMTLGYQYTMNLISQLEDELPDLLNLPKYRLSTFFEDAKNSSKYYSLTEEQIQNWFVGNDNALFFISFTQLVDDKDMWQKYGNNGNGICLVFDRNILKSIDRPSGMFVQGPLDVIYKNKSGHNKMHLLFDYLGRIEYESFINDVQQFEDIDKIFECKIKSIDQLCCLFSSFIKDKLWHNEEEVRIVINRNYNPCEKIPDVKVSKNGKPYIEIDIPLSSIKRIIIGSCVSLEDALSVLSNSRLLGLDTNIISFSTTPLQQ